MRFANSLWSYARVAETSSEVLDEASLNVGMYAPNWRGALLNLIGPPNNGAWQEDPARIIKANDNSRYSKSWIPDSELSELSRIHDIGLNNRVMHSENIYARLNLCTRYKNMCKVKMIKI